MKRLLFTILIAGFVIGVFGQNYAGPGGQGSYNLGFSAINVIPVAPGGDIGVLATNATAGTLLLLGCGGYTVNTTIVLPTGVGIKGQGDCTVITNKVDLANGPCITMGDNTYLGFVKGWRTNSNDALFSAFVGMRATISGGFLGFTNAVLDHVTYTNGYTDGWYVSNTNPCSARLYDCTFQTVWDAGAIFLGNHNFTYFNCSFVGNGPIALAALSHGFYQTSGSNTFYGCYFSGSGHTNSAVGTTQGNYGFAMDGNGTQTDSTIAANQFASFVGCRFRSVQTAAFPVFDISNGHDTATNGTVVIDGSDMASLKIFGPYNSSWLVATGGVQQVVNTNLLILTSGATAKTYTFTNVGGSSTWFTNITSFFSVIGVSGHWTNYDDFSTVLYISTGTAPTNATWADAGGGPPTPVSFYGYSLTNFFTVPASNVVFNGLLTLNGVGTNGIILGNAGAVVNTNLVGALLYTNNYGAPIQISVDVAMTEAAVAGFVGCQVLTNGVKARGIGQQTTVGVIADSFTNQLSVIVPNGVTYQFTNTLSGGGNTATLVGGQILIY